MQKKKHDFTTIPGNGNRDQDQERNRRADEEMDKLIMQAVQTFLISVATPEQRAFVQDNWEMAHGIMQQCAACGILEGLEAQVIF